MVRPEKTEERELNARLDVWVEGLDHPESVATDAAGVVYAGGEAGQLYRIADGSVEEIGYEAIADVQPGGHFFSTQHTMERYRTAFYQPLVADLSNFGNWTEAGSKDATQRANAIWKRVVEDYTPIARADEIDAALEEFIARGTAAGGAEPES